MSVPKAYFISIFYQGHVILRDRNILIFVRFSPPLNNCCLVKIMSLFSRVKVNTGPRLAQINCAQAAIAIIAKVLNVRKEKATELQEKKCLFTGHHSIKCSKIARILSATLKCSL